MKPIPFTTYKDALEKQPVTFFDALEQFGFDAKNEALAKRMMLTPEQSASITMGMYYVLLGLRPAEELAAGIAAEVKFNEQQAQGLASEALDIIVLPLEEKIFELEAMAKEHEEQEEPESELEAKEEDASLEKINEMEQEEEKELAHDGVEIESARMSSPNVGEVPSPRGDGVLEKNNEPENRDSILENLENPPKGQSVIFKTSTTMPVAENKIPIKVEAPHDLPVEETKKEDVRMSSPNVGEVPSPRGDGVLGFPEIPKVNIIDIEKTVKPESIQKNPLDDAQTLHNAQEHLRELARAKQNTFVAQKMAAPFALPKKETTIIASTTPSPTPQQPSIPVKDPYKETV